MNNYTYTDACRNIFNTIKTSGHSSLEKYTSHLLKGLCERGSWKPNKDCNILSPQLFWISQLFFPVLLGSLTGGLRAQPLVGHGSHSSIFSPTDLNFLSPGLYNNLTPTYFLRAPQFALNSTPRQPRSPPDIFYRMHLLFTQVHFFFWQLGLGQYAPLSIMILAWTQSAFSKKHVSRGNIILWNLAMQGLTAAKRTEFFKRGNAHSCSGEISAPLSI